METTKIPKQLQNDDFRFLPLQKESKDPIKGQAWSSNLCNFKNDALVEHLNNGNNGGISGGYGNLLLLDVDDESLSRKLESKEEFNTFTINSVRNRCHFYFILDGFTLEKGFQKGPVEFRWKNQYVVMPGCYVDSKKCGHTKPGVQYKGKYEITNDSEVKRITKLEFDKIVSLIPEKEKEKKLVDESRSGKEMVVVHGLRKKGKTFEDVDKYMTACRFPKWMSESISYKHETYDKAIESAINRKEEKNDYTTENNTNLNKAITSYFDKDDLADKFIKIQPMFYDEYKNWWMWKFENYCWKLVDEIDLLNAISKHTTANTIKTQEATELIMALKQRGRKNKPKDAPKTWIQFKNIIVDLQTEKRFEASPEYFITNPIPWKLGTSENTPTIDKLFGEWMKGQDESWKQTLYEICAYTLLPDYPLHIIFALLGDGSNGKGSFMRIMEKFIGEDNTASTDIDLISDVQSERAKIYKKLLCLMGEIDKGIFKKTKWLKRLSGDDTTPMRDLYKKSMDFRNYAKMIMAANKLPDTPDKSKGFFRRWVCIDFKNQFENKGIKIENTVPDEEFENLANKCIKILKKLLDNGKFINQGTIEEQTKRYEERATPILEFIEKYYEEVENSHIELSHFCHDYNEYLRKNREEEKSNKQIAGLLRAKKFNIKKINISRHGKDTTTNCIMGLKMEEFNDESQNNDYKIY